MEVMEAIKAMNKTVKSVFYFTDERIRLYECDESDYVSNS